MSLQESPIAPLCYPQRSKRPRPSWTDDRRKTLNELHEQGFSATIKQRKINELYGTNFSRNAIIGATHRANLSKRMSTVRCRPNVGGIYSIKCRAVPPKKTIETIPAPEFLGLTFLELEPNQCRYPRGEETILFCGQPMKDDSSYCAYCHSITHRVAQ